MPRVQIKTGLTDSDGKEEVLSEYICDQADCPNIAIHILGVIVELRQFAAVCDDCYKKLKAKKPA
jgi:hypothetical protein